MKKQEELIQDAFSIFKNPLGKSNPLGKNLMVSYTKSSSNGKLLDDIVFKDVVLRDKKTALKAHFPHNQILSPNQRLYILQIFQV